MDFIVQTVPRVFVVNVRNTSVVGYADLEFAQAESQPEPEAEIGTVQKNVPVENVLFMCLVYIVSVADDTFSPNADSVVDSDEGDECDFAGKFEVIVQSYGKFEIH